MQRYFFHVSSGTEMVKHDEGQLLNLKAIPHEVALAAADIARDEFREVSAGSVVVFVHDENGKAIYEGRLVYKGTWKE